MKKTEATLEANMSNGEVKTTASIVSQETEKLEVRLEINSAPLTEDAAMIKTVVTTGSPCSLKKWFHYQQYSVLWVIAVCISAICLCAYCCIGKNGFGNYLIMCFICAGLDLLILKFEDNLHYSNFNKPNIWLKWIIKVSFFVLGIVGVNYFFGWLCEGLHDNSSDAVEAIILVMMMPVFYIFFCLTVTDIDPTLSVERKDAAADSADVKTTKGKEKSTGAKEEKEEPEGENALEDKSKD